MGEDGEGGRGPCKSAKPRARKGCTHLTLRVQRLKLEGRDYNSVSAERGRKVKRNIHGTA